MTKLKPDSSRKKEKRNKSTKLEMKRRQCRDKADNAEIQKIIRDYDEKLYGNKMDNLEEMNRFLESSVF